MLELITNLDQNNHYNRIINLVKSSKFNVEIISPYISEYLAKEIIKVIKKSNRKLN